MLLEEAFLGAALRAANQAHRTVGGPGEHQRRDGAIIIGELALRDLRLGEDDAAGIAYLDVVVARPLDRLRRFLDDVLGRLVLAKPEEARMATTPSAVNSAKAPSATSSGARKSVV